MAFWKQLNSNFSNWFSGAAHRQKGMQNGESSAGVTTTKNVTIDSAMQLSACYRCVRLITETIAALPIIVYDVNPETGERKINRDHRLTMLLGGKVNRWQTRQEYMETLVYQLTMMGNDYSLIHRNKQKDIVMLEPLMSPQMQVTLLDSGALEYRYNDGTTTKVYTEDQIWHNKLFGNGVIGMSPLSYARQSLAIGLSAEDAVAKVYANGGKPSGVLSSDKVLTKDQRGKIKENFDELANGGNQRMFVLEAGFKWEKISLSPQDIEMLASRRFQIEDIARFYGVPSVLINDTQSSTAWGSGIEQIVQGFYKFGLKPYIDRYKASIRARLLKPEERHLIDIDFDIDALLMPSFAERIKAGKEAVSGALLTPNEWRRREGMMPLKGGDSAYMQQQMVPIDMLSTIARPALEGPKNADKQTG